MSEEDCGYYPPSHPRTGCKCNRCAAVRAKREEKQREKWANDPEWRAKRYAAEAARQRERYANDPEWRAKRYAAEAARQREKRASDPEWRAKENTRTAAYHRARYANDTEYRAKKNASEAARKRAKYQALCDEVDAIQLTQEDVMDVIWESLK